MRKLESSTCHALLFLDAIKLIGNKTTCLSNLEIIGLKKFLGLPNWTQLTALSNFGCPQDFFSSNYFQIGQHVPLHILNILN